MILSLLGTLAHAGAVPGDDAAWTVIGTSPVTVECTRVDGKPWCRSFGRIHAPIDQVAAALREMPKRPDLFSSVLSIDVLAPNIIHVVLDYPAPLADRDYVARYSFSEDGDARIYRWEPVVRADAPPSDERVRLPHFTGEWRLEPRGDETWVRYTWEAEIGGSLPEFAYKIAWRRAGYEALRDLAHTRTAALSAK